MMGSGKTSIGRAISQKANMSFIDTDIVIEDRLKMTIPHIFEQYGESYFRNIESKVACQVASYTGTIIATGGGMVINPQNMKILKASGFLVYLRCSAKQLYNRTLQENNRPLLSQAEDRLTKIKELLVSREPLYARYSNFTIDVDDDTVDKLSETILKVVLHEYSSHKRT